MAIAIPDTNDALMEFLTDKSKMDQVLSSPESLGAFTSACINSRLSRDPELLAQQREQVELVMMDILKSNDLSANSNFGRRLRHAQPDNVRGRRTRQLYNRASVGARTGKDGTKHDSRFENLADYFCALAKHTPNTGVTQAHIDELSNAMSSVRPSDGGFLVPETFRAELLQLAHEEALVRPRARVVPMESETLAFPCVAETSRVSSLAGGVVGYWTGEGATLTGSNPKFSRVVLRANKLALYTEVPNELLADAKPALDMFLGEVLPEGIVWFEDVAFSSGGGVGEPLGFYNAPAMVNVTRSTTVAGSNVEWVDCANMYARMLPQSLKRAVWVCSNEVLPSLLTMTVGSGNAAVWIGGGNFPSGAETPPMTMLGRPLLVSEKAGQVGAVGDLAFVDFGHYLIGDRMAMSARQSEDFKFSEDATCFRVIERVDGTPWLRSSITPANNGDPLSAFVQLAAAA